MQSKLNQFCTAFRGPRLLPLKMKSDKSKKGWTLILWNTTGALRLTSGDRIQKGMIIGQSPKQAISGKGINFHLLDHITILNNGKEDKFIVMIWVI